MSAFKNEVKLPVVKKHYRGRIAFFSCLTEICNKNIIINRADRLKKEIIMEEILNQILSEIKKINERLGNVEEKLGNVEKRLGNVEERLGNVEEKLDAKGKVKTSHTLNPVPFYIIDEQNKGDYILDTTGIAVPGVANTTATWMNLLGYEAPSIYEKSLIKFITK